MSLHSELGASRAERWMNCSGSISAEEGLPNYTSDYAIEGTAAHMLGERALRKNLPCDTWLGVVLQVDVERDNGEIEKVPVEVTEEMCEAVQEYVDYCRTRLHKAIDRSGAKNVQRFVEYQFTLEQLNPPVPMFGTSDFVIWDDIARQIEVIDLKYGRGVVVEAEDNLQFMYYALGTVLKVAKRPVSIRVTVVQPRGDHPDGAIRSWEFGWDTLLRFKHRLLDRAHATRDPNAPRKVGEWCRFCRAQAICPEQRQAAIELAQEEFDTVENYMPPIPALMTDEQVARVLKAAPLIEGWFTAVRNFVTSKLDRGEIVPGWKLVPKRATRRWRDEAEAEKDLRALLNNDAYEPAKLKSPAQAEKALKAIGIGVGAIAAHIEKKSSGTNLVPDTDPRPALVPSAQQEFEALPVATDEL